MRCQRPIDISIKSGSEVIRVGNKPYQGRSAFLVPCGKCLACKNRRKSEMVFRMDSERRHGHLEKDGTVRRYRHCFFVTLTYAEPFVPKEVPTLLDHRTGEVLQMASAPLDSPGLLNPLHLKEFMKRIRRYYDLDCKVFAVGEYGDEGDRPHYHLIFYSDLNWQETVDACRRAWSFKCPEDKRHCPGAFCVKDGKYNTWRFSFGRVDVKPVNIRRIRYCAKYIVKDNSKHEIPKFARLSHFLGTAWLLTPEARSTRDNKRLFAFVSGGKRSPIGRYFTHRIFRKEELRNITDAYLFEFENPPAESEFGENYRAWYDSHIAQNNALYRASLASAVIPKLTYV